MLERALVDARARRMRILEAFALHNLGMSYARLGNLDVGIDHQRQAARIADETTAARLRINTRIYETIFLVWRGAPGDLGHGPEPRPLGHRGDARAARAANPARSSRSRGCSSRGARSTQRSRPRATRTTRLASAPVEEWEELIRLTFFEALLSAGEDEEANAGPRRRLPRPRRAACAPSASPTTARRSSGETKRSTASSNSPTTASAFIFVRVFPGGNTLAPNARPSGAGLPGVRAAGLAGASRRSWFGWSVVRCVGGESRQSRRNELREPKGGGTAGGNA